MSCTALLLAATGCTDNADQGSAGAPGVNPTPPIRVATVTPAHDEDDGVVVIGVGEQQTPDQLMSYLPNQTAATCSPGPRPDVTLETPNGWRVTLTYGSQTVTAENTRLGFSPAAQFTTDAKEIDDYNDSMRADENRRITASTDESGDPDRGMYGDGSDKTAGPAPLFNGTGLTWGKPGPEDVEVKLSRRPLPRFWSFREDQGPSEFSLAVHINC